MPFIVTDDELRFVRSQNFSNKLTKFGHDKIKEGFKKCNSLPEMAELMRNTMHTKCIGKWLFVLYPKVG